MTILAKNAAIYRKSKEATSSKAVYQSIECQKAARLRLDARRLRMGSCHISVAAFRTHPISTSFLNILVFLAAVFVFIQHLER